MHSITTTIKGLTDLKTPIDKYSTYDASNQKYLVEYKARRKWFDTTQIEEDKLDRLLEEARAQDRKQVLYVVYDGVDSIHYFNITNLCNEEYDFKWTMRKCPATTDFNRNQMIDKSVGEICWTKAMYKMKIN